MDQYLNKITLEEALFPFKSKRLSPFQPVEVWAVSGLGLTNGERRLLSRSTLEDLSQKMSLSQFGPTDCDLENPLFLVVSLYPFDIEKEISDHQMLTGKEFNRLYGRYQII